MRKILTSYHPPLLPVLRTLAAEEPTEFYTVHADFVRQLRDIDLKAYQLGEQIEGNIRGMAFNTAAHILRQLDLHTNPQLPPLVPSVAQLVERELAGLLYPRLGDLAGLVIAAEATKPQLVILHNDVEPAMRVLALWAKAQNIPCLHVPHSVYIDDFGRGEPGTDVHDLVTASNIAVAGPYQSNWYLIRGGQPHMTGLPQFDKWAKLPVDRMAAQALFNLSPHRPALMYASSWRQDTNLLGCHGGVEESYDTFLDVVQTMPDIQVIVKTHPRGGNLQYHIDRAKEKGVTCLVTDSHLELLLQAVDVVIAYGPSNLLLEASFFPHLVLMSIAGFPEDKEILTVDESYVQLEKGIQDALGNGPVNLEWFRYKYTGVSDGLAYRRITELAKSLCQ